MRVHRLAAAASVWGVLLVAATGAGAAPTLTADRPCYIEGGSIALAGGGFSPGGAVALSGQGVFAPLTAGADGSALGTGTAPFLGTALPSSKQVEITATDQATGAAASVQVRVATFTMSTSSGFRSVRAKRAWKFSGLFQRPGKPIYGHFRLHGKTYANYRFGVPQAPCGTLKRNAPLIPSRSTPAGTWKIQVDFERRYNAKATPRLTGSTTVIRTFG